MVYENVHLFSYLSALEVTKMEYFGILKEEFHPVILICSFLVISDIDCLFTCLLTIYFLVYEPFVSFPSFLLDFSSFYTDIWCFYKLRNEVHCHMLTDVFFRFLLGFPSCQQ